MNFREVLPATVGALQSWPQLHLTILRDTTGRVRVLVEVGAGASQPSDADVAAIEASLHAKVGEWVGANTPVWAPRSRESASMGRLLSLIHAKRRQVAGNPNLWILERHTARHAWTGEVAYDPPWPIQDVDGGKEPAILTFFSHKGGTGRTTALAACALQMARRGHSVLVIDLDLEAPGLGTLFGDAGLREGVVDLLMMEQPSDLEVRALTVHLTDDSLIGSGAPIRLLHAGQIDADYMEMLARLDTHGASDRSGLTLRLQALFKAISQAYPSLDYLLVDARAGFHDLGGLMLTSLCHGAIVVGTANEQSWLGLQVVARLLNASPSADPIPLIVLHGMAPLPGDRDEAIEISAFRDRLYDELCTSYYSEPVPAPADQDTPHDAIPIPWMAGLRAQGGQLSPRMIAILTGSEFTPLVDRVVRTFPPARGLP